MNTKINCVIVDDEVIAREILVSYIEKTPNLFLLKSCKNALEAIEVVNNKHVDILFLDINMPGVSGLSLAKTVSKKIKIIFTTAYREYAVDGFNLQAVDYLLKPISFERFLQAIQVFFKMDTSILFEREPVSPSLNVGEFLFIRSERKMVKVDFSTILYVESLGDYIKIHTEIGVVVAREAISTIEGKLPKDFFLRIHRSYIVSIKHITSFTREFVEIATKALPISRSYKEFVLEKLRTY